MLIPDRKRHKSIVSRIASHKPSAIKRIPCDVNMPRYIAMLPAARRFLARVMWL
jgi:hypothetical protein